MEENSSEQLNNSKVPPQLQAFAYKKGQSGNPGGRPKNTLKEYTKHKLANMTEDEREEFLNGLDKRIIWEMAEGKAKADIGITGNLTISQVLDELENGPTPKGQELEDK